MSTFKPLISIIITILNGEKTIDQCLKSIASQTFTDYELVIVDGGSQDRTVKIVNNSNVNNKIVQIIPGIGLYAGLNTGIKLSTGNWLYFLGADDELYSSDTLQEVSEIIKVKQPDSQVLVGNVRFVKQGILFRPTFGSSPYWVRHELHHQGMFYQRDVFDTLTYNEKRRIASDYEFNLRLALNGVIHQYIDVSICNFGGDGISENQLKDRYFEMKQVHQELFTGLDRLWIIVYFEIRRNTGTLLRRYNLLKLRTKLKELFA